MMSLNTLIDLASASVIYIYLSVRYLQIYEASLIHHCAIKERSLLDNCF